MSQGLVARAHLGVCYLLAFLEGDLARFAGTIADHGDGTAFALRGRLDGLGEDRIRFLGGFEIFLVFEPQAGDHADLAAGALALAFLGNSLTARALDRTVSRVISVSQGEMS